MTQNTAQDNMNDQTPEEEIAAAETAPAESGAELDLLRQKLAEANDKMLRALAEADNVRKRGEKERQDTAKYAVTSFARDMLVVADNLSRAIFAITPEQRDADPVLKNLMIGIDATQRVLMQALETNGIKRVDPMGQKFDPNLHEVMFEAEMPGKDAGTVIQVLDAGYTIFDRLLRPARVGVAKGEGAAEGGIDQQV
jgi:molecular chaperone GrpE